MDRKKIIVDICIIVGIVIMAVPLFWKASGQRKMNQLIADFERTLEDKEDDRD